MHTITNAPTLPPCKASLLGYWEGFRKSNGVMWSLVAENGHSPCHRHCGGRIVILPR